MKLEQQLTSKKISEKLGRLGMKHDSLYMWVKYSLWDEAKIWDSDIEKEFRNECLSGKREYAYPAYTVAELGEFLNKAGADNFIKAYGEVFNFKGTGRVGTLGVINLMRTPDMGGKMLIYLIENKLI